METANLCSSVETAVRGLKEFCRKLAVTGPELVQVSDATTLAHLENRSTAKLSTCGCRPVEVSVAGLNHTGFGIAPVTAGSRRTKIMQVREPARCRDLEDGAKIRAALVSRPLEVSVLALNQVGIGARAIGTVQFGAESVEGSQRPARRDLEDGTELVSPARDRY